jgi:hypothetical protein
VRDAIEVLAADHDVISSVVKVLVATGPVPAGASVVAYSGGPSRTLTLPPANALGTSTSSVVILLNLATVSVTVVPSRGDTINGLTSLSVSAGAMAILASDGVNRWLVPVSSGGVSDGDKGDVIVSGGGTVWTLDATAVASLNIFTDLLKGIVPASGGGTTNFLRADATWAALPTGTASMTATTINVAYGAQSATATVVDAGISGSSKLLVFWGNVLDTDENQPEMDDVTFTATPGSGQMTVKVSTGVPSSVVGGAYKINYMVA